MKRTWQVMCMSVALAAMALAGAESEAAQWRGWHKVELPNGNQDRVRVAWVDSGTRCDYERASRFDSKLISKKAPWAACRVGGER